MIRRKAAFLLPVLLIFASLSNAFAAGLDRTSPYTGQYLLAINTSADITVSQPTGTITGETVSTKSALLSTEPAVISQDGMPVVGVSEADGKELYQVDPGEKLKGIAEEHSSDTVRSPQTEIYFAQNQLTVGSTKNFYTVDLVQNAYVRKQFVLKYIGSNCNIWLDSANDVSLTVDQLNDLGATYDSYIYTNMTSNFGTSYDRDADGRLAILLYDVQDGYSSTSLSYVAGFFDSHDLSGTDSYSNKMDVIHVDTYPAMGTNKAAPNTAQSKSTIAHENQHLINYSYSYLHGLAEMPLWLNEGLSMAAQHMLYGPQTSRISYYSGSSAVRDGRSVFDWRNTSDALPNYAQAYVFVQYLRTQTMGFPGGGTEIFKDMIQSTNRTSAVVEDEMRRFYSDITLADILIHFKIATFLKESGGPYGFMGEAAFNGLSPQLFTGSSANLAGGGAVVRRISSYVIPSGGSGVQYIGFGATPVARPEASIPGGAVEKGTAFSLNSATSGASIRYTLDGTVPSPVNGILYSGPIAINANMQLQAIAYKDGAVESEIVTYNYKVRPQIVSVSSPAGAVIGADTVTADLASDTTELTIELGVSDGAFWALYSDAACTLPIPGGRLTPAVGVNTAYIKVTAPDGVTAKVYTLSITVVWAPPRVTADDIANTIEGIDFNSMEYAVSTDGGATYGAYTSDTLPELGGSKTVKVRMKAVGGGAAGPDTVLNFTVNFGDINGDGFIGISDVIITAQIAVGRTESYTQEQIFRANVSNKTDSTVDVSDVVLIAERAVGGGALFPVELQ